MPQSVFLLYSGDHEDRHVVGVFSSFEKLEDWAIANNYEYDDIHERVVDEPSVLHWVSKEGIHY